MSPPAKRAAQGCVLAQPASDRARGVPRNQDGKVVSAKRLSRQAAQALLGQSGGRACFLRDPKGLLLEAARKLVAAGHRVDVLMVEPPRYCPDQLAAVLRHVREETDAGRSVCGIEKLADAVHIRPQTVRSIVAQLKRDNLIVDKPERDKRGPLKPRLSACTAADYVAPAPRAQSDQARTRSDETRGASRRARRATS
jgi:hypothetical protein